MTRKLLPVAFLIASIALVWRVRHAFFIYDDIAILYVAAGADATWFDCIRPMSNGFWRPNLLLLARLLVSVFGESPLALHLAAAGLHALAASLFFAFCRGAARLSTPAASLVAILFLLHSGGWSVPVRYQNSGDSMLAAAILGGLIVWDKHLKAPSRWRLAGISLFFLLAIGAKETGVVYPVVLGLWAWAARGSSNGRPYPARDVAVMLAISFAYGIGSIVSVRNSAGSYLRDALGAGAVAVDPVAFFRQMMDYFGSALIPYLNVLALPESIGAMPHSARWILRFALAGGLAWALWRCIRSDRRVELFGLLSAGAIVALPSLRSSPPSSHYLYAALPFGILAILEGARRAPSRDFAVRIGLSIGWLSILISGWFVSPSIRHYRAEAETVERLADSAEAHSKDWGPHQRIAILGSAHPGPSPEIRHVYTQLLLWLRLPELHPELRSIDEAEAIDLGADEIVYRFDGSELRRVK